LEKDTTFSVDMAMTTTTVISLVNKVTAHWAQKLINRRLQKMGILDTGATSGAAPEEDEDAFEDTGKLSKKTFMFLDKRTNKATKKMLLKHKLCPAASKMNIVPGLHSTLVSIPKLAYAGYTTVISKEGAAIYDDHTTTITADKPPILEANRCNLTGLWKLPLHAEETAANGEPPHNEAINVIFNLPSTCQNFLWYHAAAGFPPKETFIRASSTETMQRGSNSPSSSSTNICQIWMRQQKGTSMANAKGSDQRNKKL
jgi:hypothetical protein